MQVYKVVGSILSRLAVSLLFAWGAMLPSLVGAQQSGSSHEVEVGILVTATAERAADVLRQLKSGADFGVLAKKNPSTRLRTTEARWGSSIPISCGRSCAMPWRD